MATKFLPVHFEKIPVASVKIVAVPLASYSSSGKCPPVHRGQKSLLNLASACAMFTLAPAHSLFEISIRCPRSLAVNSATAAHSPCASVTSSPGSGTRVSISRLVTKILEGNSGHLLLRPSSDNRFGKARNSNRCHRIDHAADKTRGDLSHSASPNACNYRVSEVSGVTRRRSSVPKNHVRG